MKKYLLLLLVIVISNVSFSNGLEAKISYKNTADKFHDYDNLRIFYIDDSGMGISIENGNHIFSTQDSTLNIKMEYEFEIMSWSDAPNVTWFDFGPVITKEMNNAYFAGLELKFEKASISGGDLSELKLIPFIQTNINDINFMGKLGLISRDYGGADGLDFLISAKGENEKIVQDFNIGGEITVRMYEDMETEMKLSCFADYKTDLESLMSGMSFKSKNVFKYISNYRGLDIDGIINLQFSPRLEYQSLITNGILLIAENGLDIDFSAGDDIDGVDGLGLGLYLSIGVKYEY